MVELLGFSLVEIPCLSDEPISYQSYTTSEFASQLPFPIDTDSSLSSHPQKGLTSDILIAVSQIGYDLQPQFDRYAAGQLPFDESVKIVVEEARRLPEGEFARRMLARRRSFGTEEEIARLAEIGPSPSEVAEQTIA